MSDDHDDLPNDKRTPEELLDELGSLKALLDEELDNITSVDEIGSVEEYMRLKQAASEAGLSIEEYLEQQAAKQTAPQNASVEMESEEEEIPTLEEVVVMEEASRVAEEPETSTESHIPLPSEATTVEEYFAAVAAAKHPHTELPAMEAEAPAEETELPTLDEVVDIDEEIPILEEVYEAEETIPVLDEIVEDEIPVLEEIVAEAADAIPVLNEIIEEDEAIPLLDEVAIEHGIEPEEVMNLDEMQDLVDLIVNRKLESLKPELEREVMIELQKIIPLSALTKS